MGRSVVVAILGPDGKERVAHRMQYGAKLKVDDGDMVKRGQRIVEWDPYTRPILSDVDGQIRFDDLVEGASMSESVDESTGIAKRVVIDWRGSQRTADLKPALSIVDANGKILKLARGGDARYLLPVDAIIATDPQGKVKAGDVIARIPTESAKTRDITGGLPRVAELFEARRPKEAAIIAEISGTVQFGRDYKNKRRLTIQPDDESMEAVEYLIPKGKHIHLQDGDRIEKGDFILEGPPAPHDILAVKGVEELAAFLVNEIQEVYRLQGVNINDKHIEVIVRQMLQKIKVVQPGDTRFLEEDVVDKAEFMEENEKMIESVIVTDAGGSILKPGQLISRKKLSEINLELKKRSKPEIQYRDAEQATFDHMLLGITRAALETESFISAASFQETTKVLANAAIQAKRDTLRGLKENVVMGRLIPAGTGLRKYRSLIVRDEDEMAMEALENEAAKIPSI